MRNKKEFDLKTILNGNDKSQQEEFIEYIKETEEVRKIKNQVNENQKNPNQNSLSNDKILIKPCTSIIDSACKSMQSG